MTVFLCGATISPSGRGGRLSHCTGTDAGGPRAPGRPMNQTIQCPATPQFFGAGASIFPLLVVVLYVEVAPRRGRPPTKDPDPGSASGDDEVFLCEATVCPTGRMRG